MVGKMNNCLLRGRLLGLLKDVYPEGLEQTMIIGVFYQDEKVDNIIRELEYLTDKGYIQQKKTPHPYKQNRFIINYKISPTGIDLCEGSITCEPGIIIPVEA